MFSINITDNAASQISYLAQKEKEKKILRISVNGGGCSGFKYDYSFVSEAEDQDLIIKKLEAVIVIDKVSQDFLAHATLDFIEELGASYFKITNPNASIKCGCGNSFGV